MTDNKPIIEDRAMSVVDQAREFIQQFFEEQELEPFTYHNLSHTERVARVAKELSQDESISNREQELLEIAALFHDTGYFDGAEEHELRSAELASEWLSSKGVSDEEISIVIKLIEVTRMGSNPASKLEQIICDADISHIGTKEYKSEAKALRQEKENVQNLTYSDREWIEKNISFLSGIHFHTESARKRFAARKQKNINKLKHKLAQDGLPKLSKKEKKHFQKIDGTKGVQTMFRTTLRNHNQLSKIADNKASIMLSISAIMLSIVISTLVPKLDNNPHLTIAATMVITVCLLTIIFSILSARPKISKNEFTLEKFNQNKFNILFFGNFSNMKLTEFEWAMNELMREPDKLYSSMSQDLYFLGIVLVKKYKLLNIAYTIFMIGMIISAAAFIIGFLSYEPIFDVQSIDAPILLNNK